MVKLMFWAITISIKLWYELHFLIFTILILGKIGYSSCTVVETICFNERCGVQIKTEQYHI